MKKIICFGDSNTFGFNPKSGKRYSADTRWAGILAQTLRTKFKVIEEGCNNRTGFFENPDGLAQSGAKYLPELLKKHGSFDIFVLALGSNDLQKSFTLDKNIAYDGLKNLTSLIRNTAPDARIIIIPPIVLSKKVLDGYFKIQFDEKSIEASSWIQEVYKSFAAQENCELLDINQHVKPSDADGLHFDEKAHGKIAKLVANQVLNAIDLIEADKC